MKGDMPLSEWVPKEERGKLPTEEYLVDAILAERRRSKEREFIAKWKARPNTPPCIFSNPLAAIRAKNCHIEFKCHLLEL